MNVYWLSRSGGSAAEGPFTFAQLKRMFEAGEVGVLAQVCLQGTEDWMPIGDELEHHQAMEMQLRPRAVAQSPAMSLEQALAARDEASVKGWEKACVVIWIFAACVSLLPIIGLVMWLFAGLLAIVVTILGVLMMARGFVGKGLAAFLLAWIGIPVTIVSCNLLGLRLFA